MNRVKPLCGNTLVFIIPIPPRLSSPQHHGQKYLAPAGAKPSPCPPGGNKPSAKGYTLETIRPKALTGEKFMVYLQL